MKHELKVNVPDEVKVRIARAKQHFRENRTTYLIGAGCLAAGYLLRKSNVVTVVNEGVAPVVPAVINNTVAPVMNNIVHNTVNNGGRMRKIIKCLETGQLWSSMTEAAEAQGKSLAMMSNHIHDRGVDSINGLHFVIDGLAA